MVVVLMLRFLFFAADALFVLTGFAAFAEFAGVGTSLRVRTA